MTLRAYRKINQVATLEKAFEKDGRNLTKEDIGFLHQAAVVVNDQKILWVGKDSELPESFQKIKTIDLSGKVMLPEIVDSHTHLIFGGDRATEYSMRLNGADYEEIGKTGGGILATMKGTNQASEEELYRLGKERIKRIHSYGVGTIEIKSGYGLNYDREKMITHLIDRLKKEFAPQVQIVNTYMAAHAIPKEFESSQKYIKELVIPLMQDLSSQNLIDAVDIFHERGYFSEEDTEKLFQEAKRLNLNVKSHADEFQDNKGANLAVQYGALSTDHLLCTNDEGIQSLANSHTIATLLPGTGFFLGKPQAKARQFLDAGCKVAIGSDYNPGSCHCDNILLIASLAAPHYHMNQTELWASITLNAAHALGFKNQGAIKKGLAPRFSIFNAPTIDHITYHWGHNFAVIQ